MMTARTASTSRVHVCHVVYARYPADPRVRKEVTTLHGAGFAIDVICLRSPRDAAWEDESGVCVHRLPVGATRGSQLRYAYQYATFFLLVAASLLAAHLIHRYQIVHVHSLPDFLILAALPSRALGARLVLDLHESMPEIYRARFPTRKTSFIDRLVLLAQRLSCALATRTITVNPTIASILESRGVSPARIAVVENSPAWSPQQIGVLREAIPDVVPEVTIVGGLNPERDFPVVFRAAERLRDRGRIRWRIIGPGEPLFVRGLRDQVRRLGIEGIVTIEDEVPAAMVPSLLARTTVGVVSYQRNPLTEIATPNKAYEYAVAGKAMVVADLAALRDLLGDTARYYRPGDDADLARNLAKLLEDPAERERLGRAARERVEAHRWDLMAERLIQVYWDCLSDDGVAAQPGAGRGAASRLVGGPSDG